MPRIIITVENHPPQPYRFGLDRKSVSLGRGEDCDIIVDCGSVSLHHAVMERVSGGYQLRDAGSTNGIQLNGVRQPVIALANGQDVRMGDVVFDFELSDDESGVLALEKPAVAGHGSLPPLPVPATAVPAIETPPPPRAARRPQPMHPEVAKSQAGVNSVACLLAVIAFFIGMAVHYHQDTGGSLINVINQRITGAPVEAVPERPESGPSAGGDAPSVPGGTAPVPAADE